jgi:hypothetical protein
MDEEWGLTVYGPWLTAGTPEELYAKACPSVANEISTGKPVPIGAVYRHGNQFSMSTASTYSRWSASHSGNTVGVTVGEIRLPAFIVDNEWRMADLNVVGHYLPHSHFTVQPGEIQYGQHQPAVKQPDGSMVAPQLVVMGWSGYGLNRKCHVVKLQRDSADTASKLRLYHLVGSEWDFVTVFDASGNPGDELWMMRLK